MGFLLFFLDKKVINVKNSSASVTDNIFLCKRFKDDVLQG